MQIDVSWRMRLIKLEFVAKQNTNGMPSACVWGDMGRVLGYIWLTFFVDGDGTKWWDPHVRKIVETISFMSGDADKLWDIKTCTGLIH